MVPQCTVAEPDAGPPAPDAYLSAPSDRSRASKETSAVTWDCSPRTPGVSVPLSVSSEPRLSGPVAPPRRRSEAAGPSTVSSATSPRSTSTPRKPTRAGRPRTLLGGVAETPVTWISVSSRGSSTVLRSCPAVGADVAMPKPTSKDASVARAVAWAAAPPASRPVRPTRAPSVPGLPTLSGLLTAPSRRSTSTSRRWPARSTVAPAVAAPWSPSCRIRDTTSWTVRGIDRATIVLPPFRVSVTTTSGSPSEPSICTVPWGWTPTAFRWSAAPVVATVPPPTVDHVAPVMVPSPSAATASQ